MSDDEPGGELPEDIMAFKEALLRRDPDAWDCLTRFLGGLVLRHHGHTPAPGMTVQDVAQEVFVRLLCGSLASFSGTPSEQTQRVAREPILPRWIFIAFLKRIARCVVSDARKKYLRRYPQTDNEANEGIEHDPISTAPELRTISLSSLDQDALTDLIADPSPDLLFLDRMVEREDQMAQREAVREALDRTLAGLEALYAIDEETARSVEWLRLFAFQRKSYKEIADRYGVKPEKVRDDLSKLRGQLKKLRAQWQADLAPPTQPPTAGPAGPAAPPGKPLAPDVSGDIPLAPASTSTGSQQAPDVAEPWELPESDVAFAFGAEGAPPEPPIERTPSEDITIKAQVWNEDADDKKLEQ